jgi:uncharacterized protein (TIGR02147 family)
MISVFEYLNYREYLEDFYQHKKSLNPHFSFQVFATQAGFQSKSFIKLVIDGKKNLSESSIEQLNNALKLNEKAFSYLRDLITFNQAKSLSMRNLYFEKLLSYKTRSSAHLLLQQQYEYFSHWYHSTIRELVCNINFNGDFEKLGKMVRPSISSRKAKDSVNLLIKLGLIRKAENGYEQTDTVLTTGNEVRSLAIQNFHLQNLMLAGDSITTSKSSERDISTLVVGISEESFAKIKNEIQQFRSKLLDLIKNDQKIKRTYHINFQFFPTSELINE